MNTLQKVFILFILLVQLPASAGSTQNAVNTFPIKEVEVFAKSVEKYAAAKGARAFLIARVGQPEEDLPKGIKFTHTAIAVYSAITLDSGEIVNGYAIHNLYQKEGELDKSELVIDYPVDFFWGAQAMKAGIIIPSPNLQAKIINVIANGLDRKLHNENYSVIANPFNNTFQNCTEHTLNILNAGIYESEDMAFLKSAASEHFLPQEINTSPFKILMGSMFMDDVSTKDHAGKVKTATFSSLAKYLEQNELVLEAITLDRNGQKESLI